MSILGKIKIKKNILPDLSKSKRGTRRLEEEGAEIVITIFYRLKTGCQWRETPVEKYFKEIYSYKSVFYHFSK